MPRSLWFRFWLGIMMTISLLRAAPDSGLHQFLLISLDDITIPLDIVPDTTPPSPPHFTIAPPNTTYDDSVSVEIAGEAGSKIYLNDRFVGTLDDNGKAVLRLNTSGASGQKIFRIDLVDASGNRSRPLRFSIRKEEDPRFTYGYKGLHFYYHDKSPSEYALPQLTDADFNALPYDQKLEVADNLLETLFFGYPLEQLKQKIQSGTFISDLEEALNYDTTDKGRLEEYILDDRYFHQYSRWGDPQVITILTRFYAMDHIDKYYFENWMAYILTQTILFSPADELDSTHSPDISNIYRRLVDFFEVQSGLRYTTYIHMMSQENWRRFRSPEDNGREMLEIFNLDTNDSHVPIAGQALQNWHLSEDSDTLEIAMNENRTPLHLFGTIIYNGDDFYRELVKTDAFLRAVATRLVDFFFPKASPTHRTDIVDTILASRPETFKDILAQIIFSKEYLLHNDRPRSAEEVFFSLTKRLEYLHRRSTFYNFKEALKEMHQAAMHYKLGKIKRVPLDSLSFAYYHRFIREEVLLYRSDPDKYDDYDSWSRQGWSTAIVGFDRFDHDESDPEGSLEHFIDYLFETVIARKATTSEMTMFKNHMLTTRDGHRVFKYEFDMFANHSDPETQAKRRERHKLNIAMTVFDYLSRLEETYTQREVR